MGIPAFFRLIVENKKYEKVHSSKLSKPTQYFFIDFNSIVYDIYNSVDKTKMNSTNIQFENYLIKEVIKTLDKMVSEVKPTKMLYIAFDGVPPRAKMVQQRWRRYKKLKDEEYMNYLKTEHNIPKNKITWSTTNISPGTKFMTKLSTQLKRAINSKKFSKHQKNLQIILNDASIPGEGEHKFLYLIRKMNKNSEDQIVIYSPDADQIVLAMATHKKNLFIMKKNRTGSDGTEVERDYLLGGNTYIYLNITEYRDVFIEELDIDGNSKKNDPIRLITDYVFLTFFGGNDFVIPIPYLKVNKARRNRNGKVSLGGLDIVLDAYKRILPHQNDYLVFVKNDKYMINTEFFKMIWVHITKSEEYYVQRQYRDVIQTLEEGKGDSRREEQAREKSPYERAVAAYQHYPFYSQMHPDFPKYGELFRKIDYTREKHVWKKQYYAHFFEMDISQPKEYNMMRTNICMNYLHAFLFNLKYYFEGEPSWSWYYRFHAPPTASDILTNMNRIGDINNFKFDKSTPFKPFDTLMLILPQQNANFLPKGYGELMKKDLLPYYPIDFELDVIQGGKHIYTEPILPNIDASEVVNKTKKIKLNKTDKQRNEINWEPFIFMGK